ncbi:hypothetical protein FJZ26_03025 [Candidatus Parvarchaeota archaeon]|nr:hypothetical protein [Candidatus Parvarchaeota archaeon]
MALKTNALNAASKEQNQGKAKRPLPGFAAIAILLAFALFFGCTNPVPPSPPAPGQNTTKLVAAQGDYVTVDYTLRLDNGTVVDTSIKDVASKAGIYDLKRTYSPLGFWIGPQSGLLPKFSGAVEGMKKGQTKKIRLEPQDGYGIYNNSSVFGLPAVTEIPRLYNVPIANFKTGFENLSVGKRLVHPQYKWDMAIAELYSDSVLLRQNPLPRHNFELNGWPAMVQNVTNETIVILLKPHVGEKYGYEDTESCPTGEALVKSVKSDTVMLDCNHPLAGQALNFEITLRAIAS